MGANSNRPLPGSPASGLMPLRRVCRMLPAGSYLHCVSKMPGGAQRTAVIDYAQLGRQAVVIAFYRDAENHTARCWAVTLRFDHRNSLPGAHFVEATVGRWGVDALKAGGCVVAVLYGLQEAV